MFTAAHLIAVWPAIEVRLDEFEECLQRSGSDTLRSQVHLEGVLYGLDLALHKPVNVVAMDRAELDLGPGSHRSFKIQEPNVSFPEAVHQCTVLVNKESGWDSNFKCQACQAISQLLS